MAVLEPGAAIVPLGDDFDELDDILGEIVEPVRAEAPDGLDDILDEIAEPAQSEALDALDDILGELAEPAPVQPAASLDDLLDEIAEPTKVDTADSLDDLLDEVAEPAKAEAVDGLDDILSELAGPAKVEPADNFDDILSEVAGLAKVEAADNLDDILNEVAEPQKVEKKPSGKRPASAKAASEPEPEDDDLSDMLNEIAASAPVEAPEPPADEKKPGAKARARRLLGAMVPNLQGKREISRKRYAGLIGATVVLGVAAVGQAAVILTRPAHAPAHAGHPHVTKVTLVPIDYAKVDLERYIGKTRILKEGGRDMLRHPQVKAAMVQLSSGETLYREILAIAGRSPTADRMTIRDNRVTISSCASPVCTDSGFRLIYDLRAKQAAVCVTEKFTNGVMQSFAQGSDGYREVPGCQGVR